MTWGGVIRTQITQVERGFANQIVRTRYPEAQLMRLDKASSFIGSAGQVGTR